MKKYSYIKLEDGEIKYLPLSDPNGKIVHGKHIIYLKEWMDENPEERKRLGWIKQIHQDIKEIEYDKQTQCLQRYAVWIDPYTIKDVYIVLDKSEEIMLLEELLETVNYGRITIGGLNFEDFGG